MAACAVMLRMRIQKTYYACVRVSVFPVPGARGRPRRLSWTRPILPLWAELPLLSGSKDQSTSVELLLLPNQRCFCRSVEDQPREDKVGHPCAAFRLLSRSHFLFTSFFCCNIDHGGVWCVCINSRAVLTRCFCPRCRWVTRNQTRSASRRSGISPTRCVSTASTWRRHRTRGKCDYN